MTIRKTVHGALFLALLIVGAQISIPTPLVPFTCQTLVVGLIGSVLPGGLATLVVASYLLLGALGLPVFANFSGGITAFGTASGGYLIGFLVQVIILGAWLHFANPFAKGNVAVANMVAAAGQLAVGTLWLQGVLHLSWVAAMSIGFVPFILFGLVKVGIITALAPRLRGLVGSLFKPAK